METDNMKSEKICYKSADGQWATPSNGQWAMGNGHRTDIYICSKHLWISYKLSLFCHSPNSINRKSANYPEG